MKPWNGIYVSKIIWVIWLVILFKSPFNFPLFRHHIISDTFLNWKTLNIYSNKSINVNKIKFPSAPNYMYMYVWQVTPECLKIDVSNIYSPIPIIYILCFLIIFPTLDVDRYHPFLPVLHSDKADKQISFKSNDDCNNYKNMLIVMFVKSNNDNNNYENIDKILSTTYEYCSKQKSRL